MTLSLTMVPKDLYYVERKLVEDQAAEIEHLRALLKFIVERHDERELKAAIRKVHWDIWYAGLPADLRAKLSLHDFKRLGECFKAAFRIDG